jgi:hypothetical protein
MKKNKFYNRILKNSMHCEININLKGLIDTRVIHLEGNMFAKLSFPWVFGFEEEIYRLKNN